MNDRQKRTIAEAAKALQDDVHTMVDTVYGLRGFISSDHDDDWKVIKDEILPETHRAMDEMEKAIAKFRKAVPVHGTGWVKKIIGGGADRQEHDGR